MGSTDTSTSGTSETNTDPWKPTIDPLKDIISRINGQIPNSDVTGAETGALDSLARNAASGNPYANSIGGLATDLLGGGKDRTGMVNDAYGTFKDQLTGTARGDFVDPYTNPAFKNYLDTTQNDLWNKIQGQFAAAGRDFSGANQQTLGRGITEGTSQVFSNQYNQERGNQLNAINQLYNGGNNTAGILSGLDQTALGNRQAGVGAANNALQARDSSANQMLNVEQMRRNLPLQNLGALSGLLTPLAQLGGKSQTNSTQNTTMTPPLAMQIVQGISALKGGGGGFNGWGGSSAGGSGAPKG